MKKNMFAVLSVIGCALFLTACGNNVSAASPIVSADTTETTLNDNPTTSFVASPELEAKLKELYQEKLEREAETESEVATEPEVGAETESMPEPKAEATSEPELEPESEDVVDTTVPTPNDAQPTVDYHNYINGNIFDLGAYASALGCRRVQDPEYAKLIMYVVSRPEADFYFLHADDAIYLFFGDNQNRCWRIDGIDPLGDTKDYVVISEGQDNFNVHIETIETIGNILSYLVNAESVNLLALPSPRDYCIEHHEGTIEYYPGGMINEREWGDSVIGDGYYVNVADGTARRMGDNTDITGTILTVDAL